MKGIIVELNGNKAIVMQTDGQFVESLNPNNAQVGEEITITQKPIFRRNYWIPAMAAAAIMIAFIGLGGKGSVPVIIDIDDPPIPLGAPEVTATSSQPILIRLPGEHLLTIWLAENRSEVSWRGEIPLSYIILRCEENEYLYQVGDFLGVNGLKAPVDEVILEVGVYSGPGDQPSKEQNAYLVLRSDEKLPFSVPDPSADYYEQMIWLFQE